MVTRFLYQGRWTDIRTGGIYRVTPLPKNVYIENLSLNLLVGQRASPWNFDSNSLNCLKVFNRNNVGIQLYLFSGLRVKARPNSNISFD